MSKKDRNSFHFDFSDKKQVKVLTLVIVFVCVVLIGTSYAWLTVTKNAGNEIGITAGTFDLKLDDSNSNVIDLTDSVPISDEEGLQSIAYTFSVKNEGNIDSNYIVYLDDADLSSGEERVANKYVKFSLIKNGNIAPTRFVDSMVNGILDSGRIVSGGTNSYTLRIWLDEERFDSDATLKVFKKTLRVVGKQPSKICKRATTLHNDSSFGTVGSLGNVGALKAGDAFNCDVNGDGNYDSSKERFYYITDLNGDSSTAVMVYYSNTVKGEPQNGLNTYDGAIADLPSVSQWPNVFLKNVKRNILTVPQGSIYKTGISYEGYVARFLTYQEILNGVGSVERLGLVASYLLENTKFDAIMDFKGYWLENRSTDSNGSEIGYYVGSDTYGTSEEGTYVGSASQSVNVNTKFVGARPVIEVSKKDIIY